MKRRRWNQIDDFRFFIFFKRKFSIAVSRRSRRRYRVPSCFRSPTKKERKKNPFLETWRENFSPSSSTVKILSLLFNCNNTAPFCILASTVQSESSPIVSHQSSRLFDKSLHCPLFGLGFIIMMMILSRNRYLSWCRPLVAVSAIHHSQGNPSLFLQLQGEI